MRTGESFPQGTLLLVEIRKLAAHFVSDARVAYALDRDGMGLSFLNIPANQFPILEGWLSLAATEQPMQASRRLTE